MRRFVYYPKEPLTTEDISLAYGKLSEKDRKSIDVQAKRLYGTRRHNNIKRDGIARVAEVGALELLAALGRLLNETE